MSVRNNSPEVGDRWRLEDIYASDELWEVDLRKVDELLQKVEPYRGKLGQGVATLLELLKLQDHLLEREERVYVYASMRLDEDNTNATYQALADRALTMTTRVQSAFSFVEPEILALPEGTLEAYYRSEPGLEFYRFELGQILRMKPHTLSAAEEGIIAQTGDVAQAPRQIFKMINNADLTFPVIKDESGQDVQLTHGRYYRFIKSSDRRVRREAFQFYHESYQKIENTLTATYSGSVKQDIFYARVHKFPTALEAALFVDNVPVKVYDNLISTVHANLHSLHRYVSLRQKMLGVSELHMYDLYVPLVPDIEWKLSYPEAVELVRDGLVSLGEVYLQVVDQALHGGWVDVYERKGKTSGAYSEAAYGVHPYILMNYQENLNDGVFTLAHEMGHAMHSYYANQTQPFTYAQYSIFTAEVASTVNESLMINHLLHTVEDPVKKRFLVNFYLEQIRTTLFRQVMFAEFEKLVHARVEAGEGLTPELLKGIYHQLNVDYYGEDIVVDPEIDIEWARIPHFYNAFYVYKYATGISAAAAISKQILSGGEPAVKSYLAFLKKGGSDYPLSLLQGAGVDMTAPAPVQAALELFASLLDTLS